MNANLKVKPSTSTSCWSNSAAFFNSIKPGSMMICYLYPENEVDPNLVIPTPAGINSNQPYIIFKI